MTNIKDWAKAVKKKGYFIKMFGCKLIKTEKENKKRG